MNTTIFRIVCDKCGRVTLTPVIVDNSEFIGEGRDGMRHYLRLCPEHKAEWQRLLSDFLAGTE